LPARYLGAKAEALCFGLFVSARLRNFEMAAASASAAFRSNISHRRSSRTAR
jgi:hypothetical protein